MLWRAFAIALAICGAACGRLRFDLDGDGDADVVGDGSGRPNVAFTTQQVFDGALGGVAGADAFCAAEASAAGLPGQFIALVSTSTIDARARLAGSRGWVGTTGMPIADQIDDVMSGGRALGVINHTADGVELPNSQLYVWTASTGSGTLDSTGTCADWTSATGSAAVGFYTRSTPGLINTTVLPCLTPAHLYCFEIGNDAVVTPIQSSGRIAFITQNPSNAPAGLAAYDAECQSDAAAANLSGTFLAAVATTTATTASRFPATTPWRRVDGTPLSTDAAHMFDTRPLLATVNQLADGEYISTPFTRPYRTGAPNPVTVGDNTTTCADWTTNVGMGVITGSPIEIGKGSVWAATAALCNSSLYSLCLEQ